MYLGLNQIEEEEKEIEAQPIGGKKDGNRRQNIQSNHIFTFVDKKIDASQISVIELSKDNPGSGVNFSTPKSLDSGEKLKSHFDNDLVARLKKNYTFNAKLANNSQSLSEEEKSGSYQGPIRSAKFVGGSDGVQVGTFKSPVPNQIVEENEDECSNSIAPDFQQSKIASIRD